MPRFSVVINGVEVAREWDWERVVKTKEQLKKLGFKWNGVSWSIETRDLRLVAKIAPLLELDTRETLNLVSTFEQGDLAVVIGPPPEELDVMVEVGQIRVVSLLSFLKRQVKNGDVTRVSSFEEFIDLNLERVKTYISHGAALERVREIALATEWLRELFEKRRTWRTAIVGPNYAKLNFLASGLAKRLSQLKIRYNVINREGELVSRDIKLVKISGTELQFPTFLRRQVVEILQEFGYIPKQVDIKYPTVSYRKNYNLHNFQVEAVENWVSHEMRGTVIMPTGGGKTFVAMEAMHRAGTSTLVLVTTRELAVQWANRVKRHLGASPGVLGGGERDIRDVTVAIYNSAVKHIDSLLGRFGLVIFDEAHHVPAETFKEVALRLDSPYRLALSATPEREDGNEHLIFEAVGPPVYRASYRSMIDAGLVVPVEHYRIYVKLSKEEATAYNSLPGDNPILLRNLASKASAKIPAVLHIVERESGAKVLVFTQFIEQAEEIYEKLRERGVSAELITSEEGGRSAALARFSAGVSKVVVTTTVLDEGVDVPDADVAVVVSGTGSRRQMIQRVGRVVRAAPGKKTARVYEIIARGTIEEALSEARHFREVEEVVCKKKLYV